MEVRIFKPDHLFGQDCLVEKLSHAAIERNRIADENAILREKVDHLRDSLRLADADLDAAERRNAKLEAKLAKLKRKLSLSAEGHAAIVEMLAGQVAEQDKVIAAHQAQEALLLARCERAESGQEEADRIENLRIYREMVAA